jgi:hypothetical protein
MKSPFMLNRVADVYSFACSQGPVFFKDADRVGITAFYQMMHGKFSDTEPPKLRDHDRMSA